MAKCAYLSWFFVILSCTGFKSIIASPTTISSEALKPLPNAILIAAHNDSGEHSALYEWANLIRTSTVHDISIWMLCVRNTSTELLVEDLPELLPFFVEENYSWAMVITEFKAKNPDANIFGLLAEGILPHYDLGKAVKHVENAVSGSSTPTIVLARSYLRGIANNSKAWLPDTFIAQLWFNTHTVVASANFGLGHIRIRDSSILTMLPLLVHCFKFYPDSVIVDGTSFISFAYNFEYQKTISSYNITAANSNGIYFGRLEYALVPEQSASEAQGHPGTKISVAPWPPQYVLDTVSGENGLIIVSNVNCGYLDLAMNFLRSVQRVSNVKVLWVAMDDLAFDFMDAMAPGCVAMFPFHGSNNTPQWSPCISQAMECPSDCTRKRGSLKWYLDNYQEIGSNSRHPCWFKIEPYATKAGEYGDDIFKVEVLVRPRILHKLLRRKHALLWTDSDMVWLRNPLPLLPDGIDSKGVDLMLMLDGDPENPCTCLLFMKPVPAVKELMIMWENEIKRTNSRQNQEPWKHPLILEIFAGLKMGIFPNESFPSGRHYFDRRFREKYLSNDSVIVVHNNWIVGHDAKVARFKENQLWDVGNLSFPSCNGKF